MCYIPHTFLHVFFFNDTATTEIYTLSLHDALPISGASDRSVAKGQGTSCSSPWRYAPRAKPDVDGRCYASLPFIPAFSARSDRKSTRLNSSHANISYAVFCLKKKNTSIL